MPAPDDRNRSKPRANTDKAFSEWDGEPHVAEAPPPAPLPPASRTETLHDPLTTSLLAEVARNASTLELSPEQIADAMNAKTAEEAAEAAQRVSPSVIRRKTR